MDSVRRVDGFARVRQVSEMKTLTDIRRTQARALRACAIGDILLAIGCVATPFLRDRAGVMLANLVGMMLLVFAVIILLGARRLDRLASAERTP